MNNKDCFGRLILTERQRAFWAGMLLAVVTFALYSPTIGYDFIVVDDDKYVFENPHVLSGFSLAGLKWAFTSFHASNWHPVTWLSHMADCSIFGLWAGGHHATSVLVHCVNSILLFFVLKQLTGEFLPSLVTSAFFSWHPTHVESVAWICERKDVLSAFFLILTLGAYGKYANRPTIGKHLTALTLFGLGLMAKPMLVTLPFLLLLLDYWPLRRLRLQSGLSKPSMLGFIGSRVVLEKLPFLLLALVDCALTIAAQHQGGAIESIERLPISARVANALIAYVRYLEMAVFPAKLCVFYPLSSQPDFGVMSAAVIVLVAVSAFVFLARWTRPWLIVGWLWFVGSLVPVIGLVQVGRQAMADRYTYLPYIGLFMMAAWSAFGAGARSSRIRYLRYTAIILIPICLALTRKQLAYWQDSIRLFSHALAVTGSTSFAESNLSFALSKAGRGAEAIPHYEAVLKLAPSDVRARNNLGVELSSLGRFGEAAVQFEKALEYNPQSEKLRNYLGLALAAQGRLSSALEEFQAAIRLSPTFPQPRLNCAMVQQKMGLAGPAVTNYYNALQLAPDWPEAMNNLAFLFATCTESNWHNPREALRLSLRVNELTKNRSAVNLEMLALAYAANGDSSNAVVSAQLAQTLALKQGSKLRAEELQNQIEHYQAGFGIREVWTNPPGLRISLNGTSEKR